MNDDEKKESSEKEEPKQEKVDIGGLGYNYEVLED